jgi:hypothetical protein
MLCHAKWRQIRNSLNYVLYIEASNVGVAQPLQPLGMDHAWKGNGWTSSLRIPTPSDISRIKLCLLDQHQFCVFGYE